MICPVLVNSTKPITEAKEVFLMICTPKPTVGGTETLTACGKITYCSCSRRFSARLLDASHCPLGMDITQPCQVAVRKAPAYKERHKVADSKGEGLRPIK